MIDKLSVALGMVIATLALLIGHYTSLSLGDFGAYCIMAGFVFVCFLIIEIFKIREYKPGHLFDKGSEKQLLKYQNRWKEALGNKSVDEILHPERKREESIDDFRLG